MRFEAGFESETDLYFGHDFRPKTSLRYQLGNSASFVNKIEAGFHAEKAKGEDVFAAMQEFMQTIRRNDELFDYLHRLDLDPKRRIPTD